MYESNDTRSESEQPTKEGHTFIKWNETLPTKMPAKNITVEAVWKKNNYTITYYNDTTVHNVSKFEYNDTVTEPEQDTENNGEEIARLAASSAHSSL